MKLRGAGEIAAPKSSHVWRAPAWGRLAAPGRSMPQLGHHGTTARSHKPKPPQPCPKYGWATRGQSTAALIALFSLAMQMNGLLKIKVPIIPK